MTWLLGLKSGERLEMSELYPTIPEAFLEAMSPEALRIHLRTLQREGADPDRIQLVSDLIDYKRGVRWLVTPLYPGEFEESDDD